MKLIFLDIDGVLNSMNSCHVKCMLAAEKNDRNICRDKYGHLFDEMAVQWLELLILKTNAKIVISSTWRYVGLKEMQQMWKDRNLPGEVIGITPCAKYSVSNETYGDAYRTTERGWEIKQFLRDIEKGTVPETHCDIREPQKIEAYCIFDDDRDMLDEQYENFCQTNWNGIDYRLYCKACSILGCEA